MLKFIFQRKELMNRYGEYRFLYKVKSNMLLRVCLALYDIKNFSFMFTKLRIKDNNILEPDIIYHLNSKDELKILIDKYANKIRTVEYRGSYNGEIIAVVVNFEYKGVIFVTENEEIVTNLIIELSVI